MARLAAFTLLAILSRCAPIAHGEAAENQAQTLVDASSIEMQYAFEIKSGLSVHRTGRGKLWLDFRGDNMRMRLEGYAKSPRFGEGQIIINVDAERKVLYAVFDLDDLDESQCLKYSFPNPDDFPKAMKKIRWRASQEDIPRTEIARKVFHMEDSRKYHAQWTKSKKLLLSIGTHGLLKDIEIQRFGTLIKQVQVTSLSTEPVSRSDADKLFAPPANCRSAERVAHPLAKLALRAPHGASSALNDLLLSMSQYKGDEYRFYLILSALAVPGDVAVMIADPPAPDFSGIGAVAFDYTSTIHRQGTTVQSNGSIWMDVDSRAFHLRGEAKETKVGPLFMDLIARGAGHRRVYANVDLTGQERQQCVKYDYPELPDELTTQIAHVSKIELQFYDVGDLDGEDCGVFVAPLPRGRWIHIWVDMESDHPECILRSEVHRDSQLLRATDILQWHKTATVSASLSPNDDWHCAAETSNGKLASLGLSEVHKRSLELQEALYSLSDLPASFSVLEVLALTGDVAIMVDAPDAPDLGRLSGFSCDYDMKYQHIAPGRTYGLTPMQGKIAADFHPSSTTLRMSTSGSMGKHAMGSIDITLTEESLVVRAGLPGLTNSDSKDTPHCLIAPLSLLAGSGTSQEEDAQSQASIVRSGSMFDSVDSIGNSECNRFTYVGASARDHNVDLWFSIEERQIKRLRVLPPAEPLPEDKIKAVIDLSNWKQSITGSGLSSEFDNKGAGNGGCKRVDSLDYAWLPMLREAPEAPGLVELAAAFGTVGLLPPHSRAVVARLLGGRQGHMQAGATLPKGAPSPAGATATEPPMDIMSPQLQQFSFRFTSTYPMQKPGSGTERDVGYGGGVGIQTHRGVGEMRVDLVKRRFFLHSSASNVSAGIPKVQSRIIFYGPRDVLYSHTNIESEKYSHCWTVHIEEALPAPKGGSQPNPFARARNSGAGSYMIRGRPTSKYVLHISTYKRVDLYVDDEKKTLVELVMHDLELDASTDVRITDWSTDPIDESWFEPSSEWNCTLRSNYRNLDFANQLSKWDLMQVFFPTEAADEVPPRPWQRRLEEGAEEIPRQMPHEHFV